MDMQANHYKRFYVMVALHFTAMYVLMYAMVDSFANVYHSLNQAYMAALMTASMVLIELALMHPMYPSNKRNSAILAVGAVVLIGSYLMIRNQTGIHDRQFLRSMIPHHAGAILMCEQAAVTDPEVRALCSEIRVSQKSEIERMKLKLGHLAR